MSRFTRHLTYANVMSTFAVFLLVGTGTAYAANSVFSTDIVDGEVKSSDLAVDAVTSGKIAAGGVTNSDIRDGAVSSLKILPGGVTRTDIRDDAVTSSKVADDNLTGADINESTLADVDAATVNGHRINTMVRIWGAIQDSDRAMPDCFPGMEYVRYAFTAPRTGWVLVNAAFTARTSSGAPIAARLENSGGSFTSWQEEILDPGTRGNIALTFVFYAPEGPNSVSLTVCDNNDETASGAVAMEGQMTLLFSPFQLF